MVKSVGYVLSDVVNDVRVIGDEDVSVTELLLGAVVGVGIMPVAGNDDGGGVRITREMGIIGVLEHNDDDDGDDE